MQSRQGLASILAYCKQDKKTLYDGKMYYHLFQSFHPDEPITPETGHEIALKFAQAQFKGYEVLVATHIDREHTHSHFIVNSVSA